MNQLTKTTQKLPRSRFGGAMQLVKIQIRNYVPTKFQLKLKEAMHIYWEKPYLNQQVPHVNLTRTL